MQPRIYTYKITFEEVPYYYYGSKKEKYYNQEYWGSLELFDYTDEGYSECISVENRLIKPVLNDPWCLNESCSNFYSLDVRRKSSKLGGQKCKELGIGIHSLTKEEKIESGKLGGNKTKENNAGIFSLSKQELSDNGKIGGKIGGRIGGQKTKKLKIGIFSLSEEELVENGKKGGNRTKELCVGIHARTKDQMSEDGKVGGNKLKELGKGIFSQTKEKNIENAKKGGKKSSSQRWMCLETGFVANAGNLTKYQKKRNIDTSKRIRLK